MSNKGLVIIFSLLIISCVSRSEKHKVKNESWKLDNYIDSVQILLTNEYQFNTEYGYGASSFLIKAKNDTLLCTAKHLLGEAMGISPEVKTEKFNSIFVYWKAFPRSDKISNDTIFGTKLITEQANDIDIILQDCKLGKRNDIIALTPRFSKAKKGEKFEIIGCEYSNSECHQQVYYATMDSYEDGLILLKSETKFEANGFSGAPVIDSTGLVIGVLSGGGEFLGDLYLTIEPLSKIEFYLK